MSQEDKETVYKRKDLEFQSYLCECKIKEGFICPRCKNSEFSEHANFCKICGLKINLYKYADLK